MAVIIDIILVLIILVGAFIGLRRGFIASLTKPIKFFLAILLSYWLCGVFATGIVQPMIQEPLMGQISNYLLTKCEGITAATASEELPTLIKFAAFLSGIDVSSISAESSAAYITQIVEKLSTPVIHLIAVVISFILLYFILKILLSVGFSLINGVFNIGILGVVNRTLGLLFNGFFFFVMAWVFVLLFGYFINIPGIVNAEWAQNFEGGYIYRFFKSMSPVDILLSF